MNKIKPTYVTFEQAKKLKEKGFYVKVEWAYQDKNLVHDSHYKELKNWNDKNHVDCSAPEQWQVVEWLRVRHNIICGHTDGTYIKGNWLFGGKVKELDITKDSIVIGAYDSPQEACSAAFDYILNNLI